MRSAIRNPLIPDAVGWVYHILSSPFHRGKEVEKGDAMRFIREHGLVLAYKDADGTIWDTPYRDFLHTYKGQATSDQYYGGGYSCSDKVDVTWGGGAYEYLKNKKNENNKK